jgi:hypothetical protein
MKVCTFVTCLLAVVVWGGTRALAEGKGKGAGGKATVRKAPAQPERAQGHAPAGDVSPSRGDKGGREGKRAGLQGQKMTQALEAARQNKGKGPQQQDRAFQKQLVHEQAKHMERQARLERIRELAVKKGDAEMIARVDKLMAKERLVYSRKLQRLQGQRRIAPPAPASPARAGRAPDGRNEHVGPKTGPGVPARREQPAAHLHEAKPEQKRTPAGPGREKK